MDSRRTLRYSIDLPARLRVGETEMAARVRNLSLGGVFLIGPMLPIGTRVRLRFRAHGVEPFDGWCTTRWTTEGGCGLAFEDEQPLDTHQLARLLSASRRMTARLPTDAIVRPAR